MPGTRSRRLPPAWWWGLALVAALPILSSAWYGHRAGWYPESDDATITMLAGDTFSSHPPLVGMVSTGGAGLDDPELHHPGAIEMYLLAPLGRVLPSPAVGNAVTVVALNAAALVGVGLALRSIGGDRLGAAGLFAGALALWGLGGEVPGSVWNPYVVALPFACFVALVVAVAAGRRAALPWALGVGSFVAQTHLSYVGLVGLLGLATVGAAVVRRREPGPSWRRVGGASAATVGVLWAVPVLQQLTGHPGNLGQIVRATLGGGGGAGDGVIGTRGLGELGRVVGLPLLGLRPEGDLVRVLPGLGAGGVVLLLVPVVVGAATAWAAVRRRDRVVLGALAAVAVALVAGAITATRIPLADGVQYQYYGLWMWPLAAVVWTVLGWSAWRTAPTSVAGRLRPVVDRVGERGVVVAGVAVLAMVAISALPRPGAWAPWADYRRIAGDVAPTAADAVEARGGIGTVVVRFRGGTAYLSTGAAVAAALDHDGVRTYLDPGVPTEVFPWGERRRFTDQPVDAEVWVVSGAAPAELPADAVVLARTDTLTAAERRAHEADRAELEELVTRAAAGPRAPSTADERAAVATALDDPIAALRSGALAGLAARGLVRVPGADAERLFTDARLQALADEGTVTVSLVPR